MNISFATKKLVSSYMLISILFFGYNMLQLPKLPYFAVRFLLMLVVVFYVIKIISHNTGKRNLRLFLCYFLYLVFTLSFIFLYDYPTSLLSEAIIDGVFPMLFFFVALDEKGKSLFDVKFYGFYYWGCLFLFVCSIYLFITMPSWYVEWKRELQSDMTKDNIMVMGTMSGFSGTGYLVGYTAFFAFCYIIFKYKCNLTKRSDLFFLFIVVFCLIFSQVRVAIFTAIVVLLWYLKKTLSAKSFLIWISVIFCFILIFIYFVNQSDFLTAMVDAIAYKLEGTSEDTRYETGLSLLSHQTHFIFGHGYGTGGNAANHLELPSVTDAEYFKLFYETGIIGFSLFVYIIIKTYSTIFANRTKYIFEFFIITFYLFAMLIADPLSLSTMLSHVFWYSIGRVLL